MTFVTFLKNDKRLVTRCLAIFFAVFLSWISLASALPVLAQEGNGLNEEGVAVNADGVYERALVEKVTLTSQQTSSTGQQLESYTLRFLSGMFAGQTREVLNEVGSNPYHIQPREGDKVVVLLQLGAEGDWNIYLEGFDRRGPLAWLVALFVLTLVVLAGWQGLKVAFSIALSLALIGYVLIPAFLRGVNPVPVAILLGGLFTLISTGLSTGWNKKSLVTAVGTMGGALVAYLISMVFVEASHVSGLSTEEDRMFFDKNPMLNPRGLLFAGIIIASVGVVEDVAVSISSGISELKRINPRTSFRDLFTSGMVIGKDHMSALANTLIYAYVGGTLSSLLLYKQFGESWLKFINFDVVVDEIIRSLSGTIGLVFTVPITAFLAAWVLRRSDAMGSRREPVVMEKHESKHGH